MTLFKSNIETVEKEVLNAESAQAIYAEFKAGKNENELFKLGVSFADSKIVMDEIKVLESEMLSKMNGSFVLTEAVPAEFILDEDGTQVETKAWIPATYFVVTTETALKNSMSSDLLDIATVVNDVRIWSDGNPDVLPTWTTYKESFN